ncbi:hypothetical protein GCM10023311_15530 [Flaviramulus aquimarinus]|uniref:Uncharacterized protein n=1 Tax=Flaviramulus aquimarinus TaxID=1170456 RepID=A0ABP9F3P2_9FLAO
MKKLIIILLVLNASTILAQKEYVPEEFDYLDYNYKYLDSNYNINIDSIQFNKTVIKYKFIKERINKYEDSLSVILMSEFGDWKKSRIAKHRITYSWERVGYHLWKKEDEVKKMGEEFNLNYPYKLQQLFYYPNGNKKIIKIIDTLRIQLMNQFKLDTLKNMNNPNLMRFAFNNNPNVLKLKSELIHKKNIETFKIKHGRLPNSQEKEKLGLSCGKENCCQIQN